MVAASALAQRLSERERERTSNVGEWELAGQKCDAETVRGGEIIEAEGKMPARLLLQALVSGI